MGQLKKLLGLPETSVEEAEIRQQLPASSIIDDEAADLADLMKTAPAAKPHSQGAMPSLPPVEAPATHEPLREQVLQALMNHLPDPIYFKDIYSRFIMVNKCHARKHFGVDDPSVAIGKTDYDSFTQEHARQAFEDEQRIIGSGDSLIGMEEKETWPDGRETWVITSKFPLKDPEGHIIGTWGVSRDITSQKHAEEKLKTSEEKFRHAQKMEAFGQLAGGIAHDFNNMLSVILGAVQLIEMETANANPELKHNIEMVMDTTKRASDLTQQLLAFARRGNFKAVPLNMHEVIHSVNSLLQHTLDKRIRIVERLNAPHASIMGDYVQLQNALLNLALNARDAMPEGGVLTFSTKVIGPKEEFPGVPQMAAKPGCYLHVKVSDTGCGMDDKIKRRAFEPFFTTKEPGKGTGLGLASVYGTVKTHNGLIELESEPHKGTTFSIFLPILFDPEDQQTNPPAHLEKGTGRILVIDDEEDLRIILRELLESKGYSVVACADGIEALEYYMRHHAEIDAIIIDMIMPRMGGYECIKKIKKINPGAKILVSSGYHLLSDTQQIIARGIVGFVQKPFQVNELTQMLFAALDGKLSASR